MNYNNKQALEFIFMRAEKDVKHSNYIYNAYKREIEELELEPKEFEKAIRMLCSILKV